MTTPDLDALVARINALADCSYWANAGWDIPGDATQVIGRLAVQAAAALVQLRDENARLASIWDSTIAANWLRRAEKAEAEVARLISELRLMAVGMKAHQDGNKQATDRAKRAESRANELEQARESIEEFSHMKTDRIAALEAENARLTVEYRKVEVLWKEAAIDASRKHDTIGGLENACRITLSRIDALQAENRLLRECARTPDLERIDAAIDAAKEKP